MAMATPCEVRLETGDENLARKVGEAVMDEALRIERKFSRYRPDNIVAAINSSGGNQVCADDETALLLDFADQIFGLSDGLFDITSGILRKVWTFDGSSKIPDQHQIDAVRSLVGWQKVAWNKPLIRMLPGMEIDLGGIAKEYAVDRALALATALTASPVLINFGGDLAVSGPRATGAPWQIAIESVQGAGMAAMLELREGAIATSGDARRFLLKDGVRYGHILNPQTGWPVRDPLRSVTVAARTCLEAGMAATLAILKGPDAKAFLAQEGLKAWVVSSV